MEVDNYLYLPTEIITKIFEYLHHNELQTASMACKYWYNAKFLTKTFKSHNVLIICKENLKCIPSMNKNLFHNIKIRNLSKSEQIQLYKYLNDFEGIIQTRHITLEDLEVCDASTFLILKKLCTNGSLKSIELDCEMNNLITLHFKYSNLLRNVEKFSINLTKLSLDLSKPQSLSLHSLYMKDKLFLVMSNLTNVVHLKFLVNGRENIIIIKELLNKKFTKNLKSLEIYDTSELITFQQPYISSMLRDESERRELKFEYAHFNTIFEENSHCLNNLTQLSLTQTFITDNFFEIISKNMEKLQTLELVKCYGVLNDSDIRYLKDLKCLKALNLNDFKDEMDSYIERGRFSYALESGIETCNENLEELKLNALNLTESCITKISSFPNLRILELRNNPGVTNDTLQSILLNCRWLRSLNLSSNKISNAGVSRLISISELKGLRELQMMFTDITDEVLEEHFRFLELRKLDLRLTAITKEGVRRMLKNCPSLKDVFFSHYH